jgi:hypothetical protein
MPSWPTCGKCFDERKSVNKHHYPAHGHSIALEKTLCDNCGAEFKYYPSEKPGKYCDSCVSCSYGGQNLVHGKGKENNNWNGGLVQTECSNCGKRISVRPYNFDNFDNNFCCDDCQYTFQSEQFSGKGNPRYIDGSGTQRNYGKGWKEAKKKALRRDSSSCVICGSGEQDIGRKPSVHHKKPVRTFDNPENAHHLNNLVCLCPKHHQQVEADNQKI